MMLQRYYSGSLNYWNIHLMPYFNNEAQAILYFIFINKKIISPSSFEFFSSLFLPLLLHLFLNLLKYKIKTGTHYFIIFIGNTLRHCCSIYVVRFSLITRLISSKKKTKASTKLIPSEKGLRETLEAEVGK